MAINIREILHPSDSDSIKFEKINYNFDQILANGGGPRGQKGQKGQQGNLGLTGEKGVKGDQGDQGIMGDTGTTNTPWFSVDPAVDSTYKILKPKRLGLTYTPVIFLGDDSFDETVLVDGVNTGLNSKITIKKDSIAFDNYITLLDDVSGEKLSVTSTYDSNNSITRFAIQNAFQAQNIQFAINVDQIDFDSSGLTSITGGGGVTLQSGGGSNIKLETLGTGIVDVDANAEFKGYVRLNNSSDHISPTAGMIRYNSVNNKFEGYFASNEWKELCTECGSAVPNSITIGGGNINANADGTPVNNNSITIGGGNINANADGTPVGSVSVTPTPVPPTPTPVPPTPTPQIYTVNITANSAIGNASIYTDPTGGSPSSVITKTGVANSSFADQFYVEANSGYNISPSQVSISGWGGNGNNYYIDPNVNSAGRVVVGFSDQIDPSKLNFEIGIDGSVSIESYTAQIAETDDWANICSQTSGTDTFTYPQGEGGTNFQNYFQNNYAVNGNSGSMKIISSNEPNFAWSGWSVKLNDNNEVLESWTNCGGQQGSSVTITGAEWIYTSQGSQTYTATPSNIYVSGGYGTTPTYSWSISGILANRFDLSSTNQQTLEVEYLFTSACDGGGDEATLTCTVTGFNGNGQSIPPVSDTFLIKGCDDSGEVTTP